MANYMTWSEFKKAVDEWLEENSNTQDPEVGYIDISHINSEQLNINVDRHLIMTILEKW